MRTPALVSALAWTSLLAACGAVDPAPPVDENGEPIEAPGAFDDWLRVKRVIPGGGAVGARPTIEIVFDAYLQDDELLDFTVVSLVSGSLRAGGRTQYVMNRRALVFRPFSALVDGLEYRLQIDHGQLHSVTGAPFEATKTATFEVDASVTVDAAEEPAGTWEEVDAILEHKCRSCHRDPQWALPHLDADSLVGEPSAQVARVLIRPFDPADSYLMQKILPDYPDRRFTVQPPPWSGAVPLTSAEIATIEAWIRAGAPTE